MAILQSAHDISPDSTKIKVPPILFPKWDFRTSATGSACAEVDSTISTMISTFFGEQMQSLGRLFTTSAAAVPSAGGAPRLTIERLANKVAVVSLNRPAKLNALDMDMFRAVRDAALELRADGDVRCVVLKGEGRGFCAGLDVKSIMSPLRQRANTAELLAKPDGKAACLAQEVSTLWRSVPCPVIAAVHGVCLGGGLQIALGADVRVAATVESQPIQDTFNLSVPERIFWDCLSSRRELGERIRTVQESLETSSI